MVAPSLSKRFHCGMICLFVRATGLVIHDVNKSTRLVLKQVYTFGVVEVRNGRSERGYAFAFVFVNMGLLK